LKEYAAVTASVRAALAALKYESPLQNNRLLDKSAVTCHFRQSCGAFVVSGYSIFGGDIVHG